ncbi:MAG TPA: hypothetical protein VFQ13_23760, partial [Anaerolineales bacterium]|nr:hypothetical protein [Anaerolineales bacterium]
LNSYKTVCMVFFEDGMKEVPNGLRYSRWGGETAKLSTEKKAEARKMLENAQTPQRRVHALLGAVTS